MAKGIYDSAGKKIGTISVTGGKKKRPSKKPGSSKPKTHKKKTSKRK